ncbi:DNA-binding transcriptional regulator, FadR family [Salinihabitans flavidus]|uniref:DNA-binding transcriptional regulator, FadR family n=1 Tax=Salinihabitans flavidus TaxID=569882 RepID=A0A1H8UPN9_9RHOB|nr:FCD domain-containing protein [Salinihabitans flavidus]SEP05076.1 DNA-binding transcriptional regulator, FadR family [Salinihabitans flavidus]
MLPIDKLRVPPAYQVISSELQKLILDGALKPGETLPPEVELAERFGVNRSTVREGIRQLESEGLVSREGRKRLIVTIPDHDDLAPRLTRAMILQKVSFRELWQVANQLEPLSAELAATAIDKDSLDILKTNVREMASTIEAGNSPAKLDMEFHSMLAEFTGNRVLLLSREPVGILLYTAFEKIRPRIEQAAQRNLEAHQRIVAALETGDAMVAREWMHKHLRDLMRGWLLSGSEMDARIEPGVNL